MNTYIVRIKTPEIRELLVKKFEKVGNPKALNKTIIVETNKPKSEIEDVCGVVEVHEDFNIKLGNTENPPINWALSAICKNDNYIYEKTGKNVDIYIADTGIRADHIEFLDSEGNSRVTTIFAPDGLEFDPEYDKVYHGTFCASQAAGNICGVAKEANIFNAKIFGTGASSLKALDKVLEHHISKNNNNPSILNMSFGANNDFFLKNETKELVENGIICVACAHNYNEERSTAPACHDWVISVGSTDSSNNISSFSNYGSTIDILAPGSSVKGAGIETYNTFLTKSGTSFSSPLVAGVLALIVENSLIKTKEDVETAISFLMKYSDEHTIVYNKPNTTNKFLFSLVEAESIGIYPNITRYERCHSYNDEIFYGNDSEQKLKDKYETATPIKGCSIYNPYPKAKQISYEGSDKLKKAYMINEKFGENWNYHVTTNENIRSKYNCLLIHKHNNDEIWNGIKEHKEHILKDLKCKIL